MVGDHINGQCRSFQIMAPICESLEDREQFFVVLLDVCVVVYLDNILIYSNNMNIHKTHEREVLRQLRINGHYAGADKCEFHFKSIEYLGFQLSPEGLSMDPAKIQTIQDWPEPWKVNDILLARAINGISTINVETPLTL